MSTYSGAGEQSRTVNLNFGKVTLYQLSYTRNVKYDGITSVVANQHPINFCIKTAIL